MYLLRAGNDHEAGKPDDTRHGTHGESNKHANDNLLHDIPFIVQPAETVNRAPDFASDTILTF